MEKLILRGVMYGADKIPDTWFEKIPGGYYKAKEEREARERRDAKSRSNGNGGSRYSGSGNSAGRSRRYTADDTMRPARDNHDVGYRSETNRRRSDRRERSSYDGPDEDDDYYSGDDRYRRRRHQGGGEPRRRRSYEDEDRYGYDDGYGYGRQSRDDRYDARRANDRPPYPDAYASQSRGASQYAPASSTAAAGAPSYPASNPMSPPPQSQPQTNGAGIGGGYVPYSHIYGQPNQQTSRQPFSPPPASSSGSVQPNSMNQVVPPSQHYQQNPYAQDAAAMGAAVGAAAAYGGQAAYRPHDSRHDSRYESRYGDDYDRDYGDRYNGYDETGRPYSPSPPRHHSRGRSRRADDDSPSRDNSSTSKPPDSRARSERRNDGPKRVQSQRERGKSRLREAFDTSQRGLGYGAVGALAGGLMGSEIGKGPIPAAIGAAVGAVGANAFEARERYVDAGPTTTTTTAGVAKSSEGGPRR